MQKNLTFIFILFLHVSLFSQGWIRNYSTDTFRLYDVISIKSGGYLAIGTGTSVSGRPFSVIKFGENGQKVWQKPFSEVSIGPNLSELPAMRIIPLSDGDYLAYCRNDVGTTDVLKLDVNGVKKWNKRMTLTNFAVKNANNELYMTGKSTELSTEVLVRMSLAGVQSSQVINGVRFKDFDVRWDGIIGNQFGISNIVKVKFDGTQVFSKPFSSQVQPFFDARMQRFDNGYLILTDSFTLVSTDTLGAVRWVKRAVFQNRTYPLKHVIVNAQQEIVAIGFSPGPIPALDILKFDKTGTVQSLKQIPLQTGAYYIIESMTLANGGGYTVALYASGPSVPFAISTLLKFDENGSLYNGFINGKVVQDLNNNCLVNPTDKAFRSVILNAKKVNGTNADQFWGYTDSVGNYSMNVDTGAYTVQILPPNNLWLECTNNTTTKTLTLSNNRDSVSFALKAKLNKSAMNVDISTPILRRCFSNTYTVKYCNTGTIDALDSYINVTLDSLLEYISSTKTLTSKTGQVYRFNLGKVDINECNTFDITTRVRCGDSTRLGQNLCTEAKIFPDSIFDDLSLWTGANMLVTGTCLSDSVQFSLRNTGTAATSSLQLLVIQDDALQLRQAIQLPINGIFTRKYPANGATWRMVVNQEPNNPRSKNPTAVVEGCRRTPTSPFTTGFAAQFPNDDGDPTLDIDCQQIRGAFDPNDKQGFPIGYKKEHYIAQNQDIEYMIRFQNTGTDTAFTVVVRDTISDKLDFKTIQFGTSSHKYEAELYGKNGVKFTFNTINLVDSFKNEPKSHGFVKYRIKQNKDLVFGTQITNRAGIYFDFEAPIMTNTTVHTIGGKDILSGIFEQSFENIIAVKVSPNPFTQQAIIELPPLSIAPNFELFDLTGKRVRQDIMEGKNYRFDRKELPTGIYIYKISASGRLLNTGKLVIVE